MLLTGEFTFVVHIYVCNVSKLRARQYRVNALPYCFYLAPLTSSVGLSGRMRITFVVNNHIVVVHLRCP